MHDFDPDLAGDPAHEMTPTFAQHMEWQTRTELSRKERFGSERPARRWTLLRAGVLMLGAALAGGSAVLAAQHVDEGRDLRILLERNRVQLELADHRAERAAAELERRRAMVSAGFAPTSAVAEASLREALAKTEVAHLTLDRAELQGARRDPDRALSAALVGGRDFVSEHLTLDAEAAAERTKAMQEQAELARARFEAGHVPVGEAQKADLAALEARIAKELIDARLALRTEYVTGAITAVECERRDLVAEATSRQRLIDARLAEIDARVVRQRGLVESGLAQASGLSELEDERETLAADLELVRLELELLK